MAGSSFAVSWVDNKHPHTISFHLMIIQQFEVMICHCLEMDSSSVTCANQHFSIVCFNWTFLLFLLWFSWIYAVLPVLYCKKLKKKMLNFYFVFQYGSLFAHVCLNHVSCEDVCKLEPGKMWNIVLICGTGHKG